MPNRSLQLRVLSPSPDLEFIDNLPDARAPQFLEELKADGGGSFQLGIDDHRVLENSDLIKPRNVVQCVVNGVVAGAFFLRQREEVIISKGEDAGRYYEFSGPGLRGWLKDAIVYASDTLKDNKKLADYRYFNFSGPSEGSWYNAGDWVTATQQSTQGDTTAWNPAAGTGSPWKTAPVGWPDAPGAKWIWDRNSRVTGGAPAGDVYFRKEFTSSEQLSYALFATADDFLEAYIDGVPVLAVNEKNGWTALWRGDIDLPAGDHVLAIKASNKSAGPAGLLAALFSYKDPKEEEAAVLITKTGDSGWLVNGYPSDPPGWTPGEVIRILVEEAQARGVSSLLGVTLDFSDTVDSNGDAWSTVLDWAFEIGTDYLSVMQSFEDLAVEWTIDPVTFQMRVFNQKGADRSIQNGTVPPVIFRRGHNVTDASEDLEYDIKNVVLLEYGDQLLTEVVDPEGTIPTYGRIESFMTANAETSRQRALYIADKFLEIASSPQQGAELGIIDEEDNVPFTDFVVGDYVKGPTTNGGLIKRRVVGIAVAADRSSSAPQFELILDTLLQERVDKIEKLLARLPQWQSLGQQVSGGSSGGGSYTGGGGYTGGSNAGGNYDGGYYGGDIGTGDYGGGGGSGGGGLMVYVQPNDPGAVPIGTLWYDTDGQIF